MLIKWIIIIYEGKVFLFYVKNLYEVIRGAIEPARVVLGSSSNSNSNSIELQPLYNSWAITHAMFKLNSLTLVSKFD